MYYRHESLEPADFGDPTPETRIAFNKLLGEAVPTPHLLDICRAYVADYSLGEKGRMAANIELRLGTSIHPDQEIGRSGAMGFVELQSLNGHYVINSLSDERAHDEESDPDLVIERGEALAKILQALVDREDANADWISQAAYAVTLPDFLRMSEAEGLIASCQEPVWRSQLRTGRVSFWNGTVAELQLVLAPVDLVIADPVQFVSTRLTVQDIHGHEHSYSRAADGTERLYAISAADQIAHQEWLALRKGGIYDVTEGKLRLVTQLLEDARAFGEVGS